MADLTVTAANCAPVAGDSTLVTGVAGEAITAGKFVYQAADGTWKLADCDSATAIVRRASGIAVTGSAAGQPVVIQTAGTVTLGATMVAGTVYYLSDTPGGVRPAADNATGDYPQVVGMAMTTTVLKLNFALAALTAL